MAIQGLTSHYRENEKRLHFLSEEGCETIINAAFEVLEKTGMNILHPRAVKILTDAGATAEGSLVKIPRQMVIDSINSAPAEMVLYDRFGNEAIRAGGNRTYFGLGPTNPSFNDFETGERRPSRRMDTRNSAIIADACPNIDYVMGLAQISDCIDEIADVYEAYEMLTNTTKPISFWGIGEYGLRTQVRMADAVAGGHDKLVEKPFVALYAGCALSPLTFDRNVYEKFEYAATSGLPIVWLSGIQLGSVSLVTMPGAFAQNLAEVFVGIVLSQILNKGCAVTSNITLLTVDMSTTHSAYGSPEHCMAEVIGADIFHYLNLPFMGTAGATDSKLVDEQAAIESSMQVLMNILGGGHFIHDAGFIDGAMSGALEQIVLSDEIIGYARHIEKGFEINEETLALDVIDEVGPGGEYLTHEHTTEHFRDALWFPTLMTRELYVNWENNGKKDMRTRIHEKTAKLLAEHRAEPLPDDVVKQLDAILAEAEESTK